MRRLAAFVLALAAGCGGGTAAARDSGIEGLVTIGPQCPVERIDQPCPDKPLAAEVTIVERGSGKVVASVRSDKDGRFAVRLDPGDYTLSPVVPRGGIGSGKPVDVTVQPHAFAHVTM